MTPYKYTIKGKKTIFHYKYCELKEFVKLGKLHGDVGMIFVRREGSLMTYKGFGTIENPRTILTTLSIVHHPMFDGKIKTND